MKSPTLVLHKAQITRIEADTAYTVYDENPQDVDYPYVAMGDIMATDWSEKSTPGQEVHATIHIWSQYPGRKEADEMADALEQAITRSELDLAPNFKCMGYFDSYSLMIDIDGVTRHGILKFRYLIEEV